MWSSKSKRQKELAPKMSLATTNATAVISIDLPAKLLRIKPQS